MGEVGDAVMSNGAAAVEFALVLPLLMLLLFGIISYGVMLSFRQSLSQAAAEGARAAAVTFVEGQKQSEAYSSVNEALDSFGVTCASGDLKKGSTTVGHLRGHRPRHRAPPSRQASSASRSR